MSDVDSTLDEDPRGMSRVDEAAQIELRAARETMDRANARWLAEHQRLSGATPEDPDD